MKHYRAVIGKSHFDWSKKSEDLLGSCMLTNPFSQSSIIMNIYLIRIAAIFNISRLRLRGGR